MHWRGRGDATEAGYDWFYPYYRDRAFCLQIGTTPYEMFLASVGAKDDPACGGRQMPSHWGSKKLHIFTGSSPTGTRILHAVGAAEASWYFSHIHEAAELASSFHQDEVAYVSLGDGASSEGEFWESLNYASGRKLPVLLRGAGQRLRHFRACRRADGGRQDFRPDPQLSRIC